MKKKSLIFVIILSVFFITGCSNNNVEGTLESIMEKVYADIPEDERPMMLTNTEVNEENIEYYLGTSDIEYEEALASESGVGSIAHSVVLVRTKDNADIEAIKACCFHKHLGNSLLLITRYVVIYILILNR